MNDGMNFRQDVGVIVRPKLLLPPSKMQIAGVFNLQQYRNGKLLQEMVFPNGIVNVGKNHALDVVFGAVSQITAWYLGLINSPLVTSLAAGDTMASHAGWSEMTAYTDTVNSANATTRPVWDVAAAASQSITNTVAAEFLITTGSANLHGIFCTSSQTKGGATGTLWATAPFPSAITVGSGDQIKVTYTVNCS